MCEPTVNPTGFTLSNCGGTNVALLSAGPDDPATNPTTAGIRSIVIPDGWKIQLNSLPEIDGPYINEDLTGITQFKIRDPEEKNQVKRRAREWCLGNVTTVFSQVDTASRQTPTECDTLMTDYCKSEENLKTLACACFRENLEFKRLHPGKEYPASCFGTECRKDGAYVLSTERCTSTICDEGSKALGTVICGDKIVPPVVDVPKKRKPVPLWVWILAGGVVLAVILFVVLLRA
jgi:hypothetical protein